MNIGNKAAIQSALAELGVPQTIAENEFTSHQYAEAAGMSRAAAERFLKACVKSGKASHRVVLLNGKWTNAYSLKPTESKRPRAPKQGAR